MRILHVSTEMKWQEKEKRLFKLIEGLKSSYFVQNWVAYPRKSKALEPFSYLCPVLALPSSYLWDLRSTLLLFKWVRRNQIHIFNAHTFKALSYALWVKKLSPAIKLVMHLDQDPSLEGNIEGNRKFRKLFQHPAVDAFVLDSLSQKEKLQEMGISQKKLFLVRRQNNWLHQSWSAYNISPLDLTEDEIGTAHPTL